MASLCALSATCLDTQELPDFPYAVVDAMFVNAGVGAHEEGVAHYKIGI